MTLLRRILGKPLSHSGGPQHRAGIAYYVLITGFAATLCATAYIPTAMHSAPALLMLVIFAASMNKPIHLGNGVGFFPDLPFRVLIIATLSNGEIATAMIVTSLCLIPGCKSWTHVAGRVGSHLATYLTILASVIAVHQLPLHGLSALIVAAFAGYIGSTLYDMFVFPIATYMAYDRTQTFKVYYLSELRQIILLRWVLAIELPATFLTVVAYTVEPWTVAATGVLVWSLASIFNALNSTNRKLTTRNEELVESTSKLATGNLQFAMAMVHALDARDSYTAGHSAAVAVYARDIARELGMSIEDCETAHLAGLLHDIGKIGVPEAVLNKQGKLTDIEMQQMQDHAAIGASILNDVDAYVDMAVIVRHHHERFDGAGYPDQLSGEHIPLISRIISVADTYSAMTTDRPYRKGMDPDRAMSIVESCKETQLDADCTNVFLRLLATNSRDYRAGTAHDFALEVRRHATLSQLKHAIVETATRAA